MRPRKGLGISAVLIFALSGCATLPRPPKATLETYWHRHERAVLVHTAWSLDGSFGLRVGQRGWSAGLRWLQTGEQFHIEIYDPLGRTLAVMAGRPGEVSLVDERGKSYHAVSSVSLMKRALGWSLPVAGLRYWVRGLPVPGEVVTGRRLDDRGRLSSLEQDGWSIKYNDYDYDTAGARPTRMVMAHGDVHLTLVIDQWRNRPL